MQRKLISPTIYKTLERRLRFIYKADFTADITDRLVEIISKYNPPALEKQAKWDETDVVLITYGDSIKKEDELPLQTLKKFINQHLNELISIVHILPFFPFSSDDGFSVIDFRKVNPELGSWKDVFEITEHFDLMVDLVINHASVQSKWFQQFLAQSGKAKDFFITENPAADLSEVVRPRSTPLLTPFETPVGTKYVWTTFSADQADLNFRNPNVLLEMIDVLLGYISKGARVIRLDAIAFLWKQAGTSCLHLPETHEVVKLLREVAECMNPSVVVLTETNVPNKENLSYFGNGDEAHMVYQFSLSPLLLHALHTGNSAYLSHWARELPEPQPGCTYFNFTASHDGIGVRPLEGLLPENEKAELVENMQKFGGFVNYKSNPNGHKSPYELNITYFDAMKGTTAGEDKLQVERFLASQIIMMSFRGIPAFYIHSFTATPNYLEGVQQTKQNRTINRRKWNLEELSELLAYETPQKKIFTSLKELLAIRKQQKAFHPDAVQEILDLGKNIFCLVRNYAGRQQIVLVANLQKDMNRFQLPQQFQTFTFDLVSQTEIQDDNLQPYQCLWLVESGV